MGKPQKLKSKPKFSALDAAVILGVAAAILVLIWFFGFREADGQAVWINFTFEARGMWHEFTGPVIGDNIYDSVRGDFLGVVTGVTFLPAVMVAADIENGVFMEVPVPNRKDVRIAVRAAGVENEDRILILGDNVEVRVGMQMFVKGRGYAAEGFCIALATTGR